MRSRFRVRIQFVPADTWLGIYWKRERVSTGTLYTAFVCLVPCLPIIVQVRA